MYWHRNSPSIVFKYTGSHTKSIILEAWTAWVYMHSNRKSVPNGVRFTSTLFFCCKSVMPDWNRHVCGLLLEATHHPITHKLHPTPVGLYKGKHKYCCLQPVSITTPGHVTLLFLFVFFFGLRYKSPLKTDLLGYLLCFSIQSKCVDLENWLNPSIILLSPRISKGVNATLSGDG